MKHIIVIHYKNVQCIIDVRYMSIEHIVVIRYMNIQCNIAARYNMINPLSQPRCGSYTPISLNVFYSTGSC